MKSKFVTIIVFTLVFAVSVAIVIGSSVLNRKLNAGTPSAVTTVADITTVVGAVDSPETTAYSGDYQGNNIYEQILNQFHGHETVFSAQNVGGHNHNKGKVDYILDGQTVTTVYETETTVNPDDTTAEPEDTTTINETTEVVDTTKVTDTTVNEPATELVTETDSDTVGTETTDIDTTDNSTETAIPDDTTTEPDSADTTAPTEETTAPIDNSQGEMIIEERGELI